MEPDTQANGGKLLTSPEALRVLESALVPWLPQQRWFGAKSRTIQSVAVDSYAVITFASAIFFVTVTYTDGDPETYQVPLAFSDPTSSQPQIIIATIPAPNGPVHLHDATVRNDFHQSMLSLIETRATAPVLPIHPFKESAQLVGTPSTVFTHVPEKLTSSVHSGEQSNTSIFFADRMILKLFRKLHTGENPDIEIGRFLTEVAHFPRIPGFLGEITLTPATGEPTSIAILQQMIENEGDGWSWTLAELARFFHSVASSPPPHSESRPPTFVHQPATSHELIDLKAAALLGRRTAELHLALATPTGNPAFKAEPITHADLAADAASIENQLIAAAEALRYRIAVLDDGDATKLLTRLSDLVVLAESLRNSKPSGQRIRIHGDYHLGQLLRAQNDFILLDFEGEPARPLHGRRRKQSPLKDVAGMLRSFSYAVSTALNIYAEQHREQRLSLGAWASVWLNAVSSEFLRAYIDTASANPDLLPQPRLADLVLHAYLVDKALYELMYELNNRPAWVNIPIFGLLALTTRDFL